jgi:cobalt/nickel transport system permease protein
MMLAVHISDGVLPPVWQAAGFVAAAVMLVLNGRRLADAEIPRIALLTAAFFVASSIHLRVGPASVHLLLNGLVGIVLGRRAVIAVTVGLVLQAILIGHGGYTSLGVNVCDMTLPAYLAAALFAGLRRMPLVRRPIGRGLLVALCVIVWGLSLLAGLELAIADWHGNMAGWLAHPLRWWCLQPLPLAGLGLIAFILAAVERRSARSANFAIGMLVGEVSVLATVGLTAVVLRLALPGAAGTVGPVLFVAHLPIAAIEGIVCGSAVSFLLKVAPDVLAGSRPVDRKDLVERDLPLAQADADHR